MSLASWCSCRALQRTVAVAVTGVWLVWAGGCLGDTAHQQSSRELVLDTPNEEWLAAEETHRYQVQLEVDQYLQLTVEQKGLDTVIRLLDAQRHEVMEVDSPSGLSGSEVVKFIAANEGIHTIEVRAFQSDASPGRYRIHLQALRKATIEDRAEVAFHQGELLRQISESSASQDALQEYGEALRIWRDLGDHRQEAFALRRMAWCWAQLKDVDQELDYYRRAADLFHQAGDLAGQADTLIDAGSAFRFVGKLEDSHDSFVKALQLSSSGDYPEGEAAALHEIAKFERSWGATEQAIQTHERALEIWRKLNDRAAAARELEVKGRALILASKLKEALEALQEGLSLVSDEDSRRQAGILTEIGWIHYRQGRADKAVEIYHQAIELMGDEIASAGIYDRLGTAYRSLGEFDQALQCYQRALSLLGQSVNRYTSAHTHLNLAALYLDSRPHQRDLPKSLQHSRQALELFQDSRELNGLVQCYFLIAQAERQKGDLADARGSMLKALEVVESLRYKVSSQSYRSAFQSSRHRFFEAFIDLLADMNAQSSGKDFDVEAFEVAERIRALTLREALGRFEQGKGETDPQLMAQERFIVAKIESLDRLRFSKLASGDIAAQLQALNEQQQDLLASLERVRSQMTGTSSDILPSSISLAQIREEVLDSESLLMSYSLGKEKSILWLADKESLQMYELPARPQIEQLAHRCHALISRQPTHAHRVQQRLLIDKLTEALLGPALGRLGKKRLLVVADGVLHYIPFSVLNKGIRQGSVRPLITEHEIVRLPSASTLISLRRNRSKRQAEPSIQVIVFADPVYGPDDPRIGVSPQKAAPASARRPSRAASKPATAYFPRLRHSSLEGQAILALARESEEEPQVRGFFGFDANREALLSGEMERCRILHLSTHGVFDPDYPEFSHLVLSLLDRQGRPRAGFLRSHDIARLAAMAETVVLSACDTVRGQEIKGEGILGLPHSFMAAGASRVVMSLWQVNERATALLMERFYEGLFLKGLPPCAALRQAQVSMLLEEEWQSPYYWAGFVLQGEWR